MPRVKVIKKTVFNYDELPPEIQEKAFKKWYENQSQDYFWNEENQETLKAFESIFPIKVKNWEYGGNNSYIDFELQADDEVADFTGKRLLAYIFNNYYKHITKGKYYFKSKSKYDEKGNFSPKVRYSKIQKEYNLTGYYMDQMILEPVVELQEKVRNHPNYTFYDLMNDCLQEWITDCNKDYEYYISEENFREEIKANNWEFDSQGNIEY